MQQRMEAERAAAERQAAMPYATSDAVRGYGGRMAMGIGDGFYTEEDMAERCVHPRGAHAPSLPSLPPRTDARMLPPAFTLPTLPRS